MQGWTDNLTGIFCSMWSPCEVQALFGWQWPPSLTASTAHCCLSIYFWAIYNILKVLFYGKVLHYISWIVWSHNIRKNAGSDGLCKKNRRGGPVDNRPSTHYLQPLQKIKCNTWQMPHATLHMPYDTWHMTHDTWHMTYDVWHMTCAMWHVTCGEGEVNILS